MPKVQLFGGKPLMYLGKIAMTPGCCCNANTNTGNETGACCLNTNCSITNANYCVELGGIFQGINTNCTNINCSQGACCIGHDCSITSEDDCSNSGGEYHGDGSICGDNTICTNGACCAGGSCSEVSEIYCYSIGGTYLGDDTDCNGVNCNSNSGGACCNLGNCTIKTNSDCINIGGTYQGDGIPCSPDPCTSCSCGFTNPCDGRKYKHKTIIASGTVHQTDMFGNTTDWAFESVRIDVCDGGSTTCFCYGTGTLDTNLGFHLDFEADCSVGDSGGFFGIGACLWRLVGSFNCSQCPPSSCSGPDSSSCDFDSYNQSCFDRTFIGTVTTEYSDLCT